MRQQAVMITAVKITRSATAPSDTPTAMPTTLLDSSVDVALGAVPVVGVVGGEVVGA